MIIPQIIHQIYEDPAGPSELLRRIAESWREHNPGWEYRFWNKASIDSFLESEFPEFEPIYRAYPHNVQRWDAIRYLILYRYGGLYVDMDYECIEAIYPILKEVECAFGVEPEFHATSFNRSQVIGNAFMASVPNHPFMKEIVEELFNNRNRIWSEEKFFQVLESTGPYMVSRLYEQSIHKERVTLLSDELVTPLTINEVRQMMMGTVTPRMEERIEKAYAIHYFLGSWLDQTKDGEPLKVKAKK